MTLNAEEKRFKIIEEKFGNQKLIKLLNSSTKEYVSILPETGGMLLSMGLLFNNELVSVLETYQTEDELIKTLGNSFRGSHLHPFPNRIDAGKYSFEGNDYQLFVNFPQENNAIHGLVFEKKFNVAKTEENENYAELVLEYSPVPEKNGYPFDYNLVVTFILEDKKGLTIKTQVTNTSNETIPVGNGWHPYFTLKSKVDDLTFEFPSVALYEVNERLLPTGNKENYTKYNKAIRINDDNFDNCFGLSDEEGIAKITIFDPVLAGGVEIWQETGKRKYNYLQIYTPDHRSSIAIEPMTCIPNALNNKVGLISLNPNQTIEFSWGINKL